MHHLAALTALLILAAPVAAFALDPAVQIALTEEMPPAKKEIRLDRGGEIDPVRGPDIPGVFSSRYLDVNRNRIYDTLETQISGTTADGELSVIVVLNEQMTADELETLRERHGGFEISTAWSSIPAFSARLMVNEILSLAQEPAVRQIEDDSEVSTSMYNAARRYFGVDKAKSDFGVDGDRGGAIKSYGPEDIAICVIDSGIYSEHKDLDDGQVIGWRDFVNDIGTPYDDNGHGTHVAGIAAGQGDANSIVRGVAHGAALVGVKVLTSTGWGFASDVISGIDWCAQNKAALGIEIITISIGFSGSSDGTDSASLAVDAAWRAGLVVVVSAGNAGPNAYTISHMAAAQNVITVGSMADLGSSRQGFSISSFSSRGPTADGRVKPDLMGPGEDITSVSAAGPNSYVSMSGTSMAAPFVAGTVALLLDIDPTLTPDEVKTALYRSAQDWRGDGRDKDTGAGRLQAHHAIRTVCTCPAEDPPAPPHYARSDELNQDGASDRYGWYVDAAGWPLSLTLTIPAADSSKDFDLHLYDPHGYRVATAMGVTRQDSLSHTPATTGMYTVRVHSWSGSGGYYLDFSGGSYPYLRTDE